MMPAMPVFVGKRITVEKRQKVARRYACASCGYATEVRMVVTARGEADGSIVIPKRRLETEAAERAEAAIADEVQHMLDLVPCPQCGKRSENAALYRQNTVLAVGGWIFAGLVMGLMAWLPATVDSRGGGTPILGLFAWLAIGMALAGFTWYRRHQRIERAASLLRADEEGARGARWAPILVVLGCGAAALAMFLWVSAMSNEPGKTSAQPGAKPRTRNPAVTKDLLPRHDGGTVEGQARQLLWTMNNVLAWRVEHPRAGAYVFRSPEDMARVWMEHGGDPAAVPVVDFGQHMVVALFEAEGSYREVRTIQRVLQGGGKLWIVVGKAQRPWAMKNPASVIALPRADGEPVFVEVGSKEAEEILRAAGE